MLAAAIRGEPPGPDLQERLTATLATLCPYRGLRPFREEDAPFFFGREAFDRATARGGGPARPWSPSSGPPAAASPRWSAPGWSPAAAGDGGRVWDVVTLVPGTAPCRPWPRRWFRSWSRR